MKKTIFFALAIFFATSTLFSSTATQKTKDFPHRGQVYLVHLDPIIGTEIKKTRPCVIVSTNENNAHSTRVIVVPLTSNATKYFKYGVPTRIAHKQGQALVDQMRAVDISRLNNLIDVCNSETMAHIEQVMVEVLGLNEHYSTNISRCAEMLPATACIAT